MSKKRSNKKRELLAKNFMLAMIRRPLPRGISSDCPPEDNWHQTIALGAFKYADEFLKQLNEQPS